MTIINLLNKIANREEVPKKIKYDTKNYYFRNYDYKEYYIDEDYIDEQTSFIEKIDFYKLNDEIEIIEEDEQIEKIVGLHHPYTDELGLIKEDIELAFETIDKLIDKVNELKKESDK